MCARVDHRSIILFIVNVVSFEHFMQMLKLVHKTYNVFVYMLSLTTCGLCNVYTIFFERIIIRTRETNHNKLFLDATSLRTFAHNLRRLSGHFDPTLFNPPQSASIQLHFH